jgi:hypothetical protein
LFPFRAPTSAKLNNGSETTILAKDREVNIGRDSDWAGRSGDRNPVGTRFSAPVQTGPGAHPASCAMGTGWVSFPGVKGPVRGVHNPPPYSTEVKDRVELYLYFHSSPSWPVVGWTLPLQKSKKQIGNRKGTTNKEVREHASFKQGTPVPGTHLFKARHANSQANVQRWQFVLTTLSTQVAHRAAIVFRARV